MNSNDSIDYHPPGVPKGYNPRKGNVMAEQDKDRLIEELRARVHTQEVVIDTLRGMMFTAWSLTNAYDRDPGTPAASEEDG